MSNAGEAIKVEVLASGGDPVPSNQKSDNFNETKTVTSTTMRKNPDGSYSKITKIITSTTKTLTLNTEVITNEDNSVDFKSMKHNS